MGTIIGDCIGTTIGIHSPFPTLHQGAYGLPDLEVQAFKRLRLEEFLFSLGFQNKRNKLRFTVFQGPCQEIPIFLYMGFKI